MIKPKEIKPEDKKLFESFFEKENNISQETCFSNLYMWQTGYNMKYDIVDGLLVVFAGYDPIGEYFHFPVGKGDKKQVLEKLDKYMTEKYGTYSIRKLHKSQAAELEGFMPGEFSFEENREFFDYIYSVEELINLSGKKYHSKKNHFNTFVKKYSYEYHRATAENIGRMRERTLNWINERNDDPDREEYIAMEKMFDSFFDLDLKGGFITVDGEIVAVTAGENNFGTAVIHLEKANPDYSGAYAAINKLFLEHEFAGLNYVNREEDLGIEGLRKAKLSYKPKILLEKITAKRI